jgi:hypothetical protein
MRAGMIRVGCGLEPGGAPPPVQPAARPPPAVAGNLDVVTGETAATYPHVTQAAAVVWSSNGSTLVVTYNDSTDVGGTPINTSGVSYSLNGGATWTRIRPSPFATGHGTNFGNPHVIYNAKLGTWFVVSIVSLSSGPGSCGTQGLGLWTSTDAVNWSPGACVHNGSADDRQSMWVDNTPTSPFYGRMYVAWGDFSNAGNLVVSHSNDGTTWSAPVTLSPGSTALRENGQSTSGPDGTAFVAARDEGGGGFNNNQNFMFRSTDGGVTWSSGISMGPPFRPPGDSLCNSFFPMITPIWRQVVLGQPAVGPTGVVHYVYAAGTLGLDTGDIYYVRSIDNGLTWSAPLKLNTDASTQAQWQPSLSVTAVGDVFVHWYDRRNSTDGQNYEIWGRRSKDNGATWQPEAAVSNQLIPQPLQPDPGFVACYGGDYNYATAFANTHYTVWTDGRISLAGHAQEDVFFAAIPPGLPEIAATHDFSKDGRSDILWYNNTSGQAVAWLVNGTSVIGGGSPGSAGSPWGIVGQRDFNGDGFADLLWRNGNTGQLVVWLLNGTSVIGGGSPGTAASPWTVAGTGDFNGDGLGDVLWWNSSTGQLILWFLNGTSVIGGGSPGGAASPWNVAGTGDFNGDGFTDVLWWNSTSGQLVIWLLNGTSVIGGGSPGSATPPWQPFGTGDFNGDGFADILWRNTSTGQTVVWFVNGTSVIGGGTPGSVPSPWAIAETGDFNGDSKSDILWVNNTTGQLVVWLLDGASVIGGGSPGSAASPWVVQGMNAD